MQRGTSPYICHLLVCVNDRGGAARACADGGGVALKDALKRGVAERGYRPRVRVSQTGCLGLCASGPNVIVYPQGVCFSCVTEADVPDILDTLGALLAPGGRDDSQSSQGGAPDRDGGAAPPLAGAGAGLGSGAGPRR